jgi:hypothetical protein
MSSDLVLRMRTCAAAIVSSDPCESWVALVSDDAARLLVEASNALDTPEPLGEPMPVLEATKPVGGAVWTAAGELPAAAPRSCPSCGDIGARTVHIAGRRLMLTCTMCSHQWEYTP